MPDREHPIATQPRRGVTAVDYEGGTWGEEKEVRDASCEVRAICLLPTALRVLCETLCVLCGFKPAR